MDDESATGTGTVEAERGDGPRDRAGYRPPRSYPYLDAVVDRQRRKRAGLVSLAIATVMVVALVVVMLLPRSAKRGEQAPAEPAAAPTTAGARAPAAPGSTTSRVPTTGAEVVAAAAPTTVQPPPSVTLTVSPVVVACNEATAETATVLSWTSSAAEEAVVKGPLGQISTMVQGNREVAPSRPCAEAPFEDAYTASVSNASGIADADATVTWTAVGGTD